MRLAVLGLLLLFGASPGTLEKFPIEKVIKNAEDAARTKSKTGTWAVVGRLYALQFEGWSEVEAAAGSAPASSPDPDPSLRIEPLKGGVATRRTRAIEAYRRSVELDASNAALTEGINKGTDLRKVSSKEILEQFAEPSRLPDAQL